MSAHLIAFDETQSVQGRFTLGGWLGPASDWSDYVAPAWDERVLAGPPRIPYLHVTELRDRRWQERVGIRPLDASDRIDEAVRVLAALSGPYRVRTRTRGRDGIK